MQATAEMTMGRSGAAWGAVGSMALCVAVLIASEFMPVSLLTPIATDLGVTEGQAGQIVFGHSQHAVVGLLVLWGFFGTAAPVGWGTWLARVMHDEAEAGGGLQVAVIQFAIMIGAAGGGLMFDAVGWWSAFAAAAALLLGSSLAAFAAWSNWRKPR